MRFLILVICEKDLSTDIIVIGNVKQMAVRLALLDSNAISISLVAKSVSY